MPRIRPAAAGAQRRRRAAWGEAPLVAPQPPFVEPDGL
jgi:hypothetical protein